MTIPHTAEPWNPMEGGPVELLNICDPELNYIARGVVLSPEDYERARACVNACAGIDDPQILRDVYDKFVPAALSIARIADGQAQRYFEERNELAAALEAMLEVQSTRRHPLGDPDEGIAYKAANAASKANAALAKVRS